MLIEKAHWKVKYKPAAPAKTHLLLAALAWTTVGTVLIILGIYWVHAVGSDAGYLVLAAALGYAKSRYLLDKTARRAVERICERGDGKCLGSFFSYKSWLLIIVMMGAGRVLRSGVVSRLLLGFIYVAVGTALLLSSRIFWQAYSRRAKKSFL